MKLNTIKQAIELLLTTNLSEIDTQNAFAALKEIYSVQERATDSDAYEDEVYVVSASCLYDLMISDLYDTYARRRKMHGHGFSVSYFQHDARKVFGFEDFTNDQLQIGYDIISDMWEDNEAAGDHDENGLLHSTSKHEVKLHLSGAECNCLIEAIEAANEQVQAGKIVYCKDGYMPENEQLKLASVTAEIANELAAMIANGETAIVRFEP